MVDRVSLSAIHNNAINALRTLSERQDKNRLRLSTSKKLNDVTDGFSIFFQARALIQRAEIITKRDQNARQSLAALETFVKGGESVQELLRQLEGILDSSRSASTAERVGITESFNEIGTQLFNLVNDIQYRGNNILNSTNSRLRFQVGDNPQDVFSLNGRNILGSSLSNGALFSFGIFSQASLPNLRSTVFALSRFNFTNAAFPNRISSFSVIGNTNSNLGLVDDLRQYLRTSRGRLENTEAILALHVSLIRQRIDINKDYLNTSNQGSDKLQIADLNEESAIFLALRSRYDANISTLNISSQNQSLFLQLL